MLWVDKILPPIECRCFGAVRIVPRSGVEQTMFDEDPNHMIHKSQQALARWSWLSTIADRPDLLAEVLNREVRLLAGIADEHPDSALKILELIDGYKDLADQLGKERDKV